MAQKSKNVSLFVGVGLMGLVAWSAMASAAEKGSAECTAKVGAEVNALIVKNGGRHPSNATREKLLIQCSEGQVGLALEGLAGKHSQESTSDKEARCQTSVKYAIASGRDSSGRSPDALVSDCMALPSDHDANCGYSSGDYAVVEGQKCVSKGAGIASAHGILAKAEKRVRKFDDATGTGAGPAGSSAQ